MVELRTTRYYGKLFIRDDLGFHFIVKLIAPPNCRAVDYIGSKNVKITDLLCLDDAVLSVFPNLSIDWSEVHRV